jgi:hypothetical protein
MQLKLKDNNKQILDFIIPVLPPKFLVICARKTQSLKFDHSKFLSDHKMLLISQGE